MTNSDLGDLRQRVAQARRIVIKAGSSSLTTATGHIDLAAVTHLVDVCGRAVQAGKQVVLVSSGAIASGLGPLGLTSRPKDLALAQAAASVGQGELIAAYANRFADFDLRVGQVLLSADDITRRAHFRNAHRALERLISLGVVPVVNENDSVATDEIRLGDNDRLAALVAHLVDADVLVLLTDVDALFDGPPRRTGSKRISQVNGRDDLAGVELGGVGSRVGSGGMRTKVAAAQIATDAGITVALTNVESAERMLRGESVGTIFAPTGKRRGIRLSWLEHGSEPAGELVIDEGAVRALVDRHASLLPAGVLEVRGEFEAGDVVDIVAINGEQVARGVVGFDATELPGLLGRSTKDLAVELGAAYEREVVHRDELVLTRLPADEEA